MKSVKSNYGNQVWKFRDLQMSYAISLRQFYCSVPSRHCTLPVVICFPLASWVLTERSVKHQTLNLQWLGPCHCISVLSMEPKAHAPRELYNRQPKLQLE